MEGNVGGDQAPPRCTPCETMDASFLLSNDQIQQQLGESIPLWSTESRGDISSLLSRSFVARNFQAALDCVNAMGAIAEEVSHHPDFHITNYRQVEVVIYTHKLKGVTENDVQLAKAIDERVKIDYSPKYLREHPEAQCTAVQRETH